MTVVFAAFIVGDFVLMKILGFALAVAVLLDVTVVRLALGPALLALAGRWNWWPGEERRPAVSSRLSARSPGHPGVPPAPRADAIPSRDPAREQTAGRVAFSPHPPPPAT
jgi:hypothetical protein